MDKETMKQMARIHKSIPRELTRGMVKVERDESTLELVEDALKKRQPTKAEDCRVSRMMEQGAFVQETKTVDERKTKAIDAYLKGKIEAEIKAGRLKRPDQRGWMKKMSQHYGHLKK